MRFKIVGKVVEKESGEGLPGLIVKAYDKDLLYDDLLGYVESQKDGQFEINYEARDFQELFDKKPDIYFRIMDKYWEEIFSSEKNVKFEAGEVESFKIEVPKQALVEKGSRERTAKLYEAWIDSRQERPRQLVYPKNREELEVARKDNFASQFLSPRQQNLQQLKEISDQISTADKVALLVKLEIPEAEISTLLSRLTRQMSENVKATYFSRVNQDDNCGCCCGCGCAVMEEFPYQERIMIHRETKPFSIDPFNEIGMTAEERDALLIQDFLKSYEALSRNVAEKVQAPLYKTAWAIRTGN